MSGAMNINGALAMDDRYRADAVLKDSDTEVTQRVYYIRPDGSQIGPFIRKYIRHGLGVGDLHGRLMQLQLKGLLLDCMPRIVQCFDAGESTVVIMECLVGTTLEDMVRAEGGSQALAAWVFPGLCDAVARLHGVSPAIIHRDLKSSNVMMTNAGIKVIDFGIAREVRDGAGSDTVRFGTRLMRRRSNSASRRPPREATSMRWACCCRIA